VPSLPCSGAQGWLVGPLQSAIIVVNAGKLSGSSGIEESMEDIFTAVVGNLG